MDKTSSQLSGTGCDFVVATTQASINSSLLNYLAERSQPMESIFYLADAKGDPTLEIGRGQLLDKTGGVDPCVIEAETLCDDRQITTVTKARFMIVTVIQNTPPGGWGNPGSWNAEVDLVVADLDHNLDSSNYLNNHPDVKNELRKALVNVSGSAFSLQQLLYGLANAALQGDPQFPGMDMSKDAGYILQMYFEELSGLFASSFAATTRPSTQLAISEADSSFSELQDMIFATGHALAGLAGLILGSMSIFEANSETAKNPFATPAMILGIVRAALQGVTNHFAPRDPIANEWALLGLEVLVKVFFAEKTQGALTQLGNRSASVGKLVFSNARGLVAIVDAVLIPPAIVITSWHIGELAQKPAGKVNSAAILEECGKVASWISQCAYAIALNDPEPNSKELTVGLTGLAIWIAAGFQLGEAEWC
ncbi:uncharacterized protein BO72DRAFT_527621 [Aspergillus fijiensis CBS 313.89]|uniref:Uncharacterized protein n=1 Tax=Aspergillus fijiensis CBS 313.89 TaxID=1448319 RepID=A0A8G1RNT2_9EURO|nr:uncharacterized protein BO72DRAFT_527621 [Aspergillus fijiensis CBS 313.89]RAK77452.1 hypothetical protein BO72DRAFT_527621 [Aspergillus fijiensis CBS 313.89]